MKLLRLAILMVCSSAILNAQDLEYLGLNEINISSIVINPSNSSEIIAGGYKGIYKSFDNGITWDTLFGDENTNLLKNPWSYPDDIYACTWEHVLKSADFGENWTILAEGFINFSSEDFARIAIDPKNEGHIFLSTASIEYSNLYETTDSGSAWNALYNIYNPLMTLDYSPHLDDVIYYLMFGYLFASDDNGQTWYEKFDFWSLTPEIEPTRLIFDLQNPGIFYAAGWESVVKSTDYGSTWEHKNDGLPVDAIRELTISPKNERTLYAATNRSIYRSFDSGDSWITFFQSTDSALFIRKLVESPTKDILFVGTRNGLYKINTVTSVKNNEDQTPSEYELFQNYPNPFNPTTKIKYSIPEECFVSLKVYSIIGEEIAELINENKKPGNYEVEFDAFSLPSGIYIYQLSAGSFTDVKKMILMK